MFAATEPHSSEPSCTFHGRIVIIASLQHVMRSSESSNEVSDWAHIIFIYSCMRRDQNCQSSAHDANESEFIVYCVADIDLVVANLT